MIPFEQAYEQFIKQRGDLFESKEIPIEEADRVEVERLDRFSRKVTYPIFLVIGILALGGSANRFIAQDWIFAFGFLLGSISFISLALYYKSYYKELLQHGKKLVITGVITVMVRSSGYHGGSSYGLQISERDTLYFSKEQVKGFKVGDIVRCQTLSKYEGVNQTIEKIGNIREWLEERN